VRDTRTGDQCLRGNASHVDTRASEKLALDDGGPAAGSRQSNR
jgi:hypothetical protein